MKKLFCVLLTLLNLYSNIYSQNSIRYVDSLFTVEQTYTNQVYATAPQLTIPYLSESSTSNVDLTMHIFEPSGDTLQKRAMLVCLHSGGFAIGTKENEDMMEFCRIFAMKGYVTATAQYRLGINLASNTSGERAVYRAIQDSRALLRYLRGNAEALRISPNHIYLLGSSAGAFIALHNLFLDKESERPEGTYEINNLFGTAPDLGGLDSIGSYLDQSSKANGIISLWGALADTTLIEATYSYIPIFLVHGTADAIVQFGLGSPFHALTLASTYGSQLIDKRLAGMDYSHETYFVEGEGHEFYGVFNGNWNPAPNQYWYIIVDKVRNFLFSIHKPTADFAQTIDNGKVTFNNNCLNSVLWHWDFGDGKSSNEQKPIHTYAQAGNYDVTLTAYSEVHSADQITKQVNVTVVSVENNPTIPNKYVLYQNYPNPFNPETAISYQLSASSHVSLKVFNNLGRVVATLVNEEEQAGKYTVTFDAKNLSSGVYFYTLNANGFAITKKLIHLK